MYEWDVLLAIRSFIAEMARSSCESRTKQNQSASLGSRYYLRPQIPLPLLPIPLLGDGLGAARRDNRQSSLSGF
ncbi:hypothetical protein XA68_11086 [Ophiocordyceps unilateralis]|uniref:Uncharacterized protein n=1 Tax=Ophiocordyceps unilateralis TaxID=268505 RepID=A0A2A9P226_OPHUN|nr:hypothetical protein XA68_11086 [Ophiocordyceps unilateralis]